MTSREAKKSEHQTIYIPYGVAQHREAYIWTNSSKKKTWHICFLIINMYGNLHRIGSEPDCT